MFLHLGRDITVDTSTIIAVFDMDTSTGSRHTKAYLRAAEENGYLSVVSDELPKSAVICSENGERAEEHTESCGKRGQYGSQRI